MIYLIGAAAADGACNTRLFSFSVAVEIAIATAHTHTLDDVQCSAAMAECLSFVNVDDAVE